MKITYVWSDEAGEFNCSNFRAFIPAYAMRRAGHDARLVYAEDFASHTAEADEACEDADLIIFQRNLFLQNLQAVIHWRSKGKVMAVDLDDAYHFMTEGTGSPSYNFWRHGKIKNGEENQVVVPPPLTLLEWGVKIIGAVITPSPLLCADWAPYAPTYYIPNYLDFNVYKRKKVTKEPGCVYVGWGGSRGHSLSWLESGLPAALAEICSENKNVRVVLVGDDPIVKSMKLRPTQRVVMEWRPYALWSEILSIYDIGVVPLAGEYDRRRSCLKSTELTLMGIPWIGSALEPNQIMGTGTLVLNTKGAWYEALFDMIKYLENCKFMASHLVEAADAYDVNKNVGALVAAYEQIIKEAK